jgi:hypothetical protein
MRRSSSESTGSLEMKREPATRWITTISSLTGAGLTGAGLEQAELEQAELTVGEVGGDVRGDVVGDLSVCPCSDPTENSVVRVSASETTVGGGTSGGASGGTILPSRGLLVGVIIALLESGEDNSEKGA